MPKLSFEFSSLNELHGFCTEFVLNWAKAAEIAKKAKVAEDAEDKPAKKAKVADETEDKPAKKAKAADETEDKTTFEQVRAAMLKLVDTDEEDTIPSILEKFNVEKISQLKEAQFEKAMDMFTKAFKRSSPNAA